MRMECDDLCIEFHDVSFRYPGQENFSLQHISLKIEPKEKLAIIGENGAGKTALYISHRLSSTQMCDKIAVLSKGELCEYGTHAELLEGNGLYTELYHMQARYYVQEGENMGR